MTDGWTLAPSGWEYKRVRGVTGAGPMVWLRMTDGLRETILALYDPTDDCHPPEDTDLVRSLWEAKDATDA